MSPDPSKTHAEGWSKSELARAWRLAAEMRARGLKTERLLAARAPGRVNLIGEHTDYSLLPVLPIAIDRSTIVVATPREDAEVELQNADPQFTERRYSLAARIPPFPSGDWANYHKAAVQGVIDHWVSQGRASDSFCGATMFVDGQVPLAAGLSSSAALTVASALAFMAVNGLTLPALETAEMVARSEWYVGTRAGGMDQAASLLGQRDHAMFIEFAPLRVRPILMPQDASIIVADSLEVADKSGGVRDQYNLRVVECAVAARIIGRALKLENVRVLGDVVRRPGDRSPEQLLELLREADAARLNGINQAAQKLGIEAVALGREVLGTDSAAFRSRNLEVLRRARHVLTENSRVVRAIEALTAGRLEEMGELMNASHLSLDVDFGVSTPRLNALVECARRAGALGARLTGAGFGGSIVALCRAADAEKVIAGIDGNYYSRFAQAGDRRLHRAAFQASAGASVIELSGTG